jgi:hypothetical protein
MTIECSKPTGANVGGHPPGGVRLGLGGWTTAPEKGCLFSSLLKFSWKTTEGKKGWPPWWMAIPSLLPGRYSIPWQVLDSLISVVGAPGS